jgi:probable metal-binding protein
MSESIHGHQVMDMMARSGENYSKVALISEIATKFGENSCFHTCTNSDLSAHDLIELLTLKGKFVESEQGISMPKDQIC